MEDYMDHKQEWESYYEIHSFANILLKLKHCYKAQSFEVKTTCLQLLSMWTQVQYHGDITNFIMSNKHLVNKYFHKHANSYTILFFHAY